MPLTITFSGAVGAGKSTTARAVVDLLREAGVDVKPVRFREFVSLRGPYRKAAAGAGEASSQEPAPARATGYRRKQMSFKAAVAQIARVMLFRLRLLWQPSNVVLVFDRYFYDSLAHFTLENAGPALKLLARLIPQPTLGVVLQVPAASILERRRYAPEYAEAASHGYRMLCASFPELYVFAETDRAPVNERAAVVVREFSNRCGSGLAGRLQRR